MSTPSDGAEPVQDGGSIAREDYQSLAVLQILFENSDGLREALDFDRLLFGAISDFAPLDARQKVPVRREKLLLVFTDADHFRRASCSLG
jgi:hypothetical protein